MPEQAALLVAAVFAVGVLHTLIPDHWMPIAVIARQQRWSATKTAYAAAGAGLGHTISTLLIGLLVWVAGVAFALRFGHYVSLASGIALIAFGGWIALSALREVHRGHRHYGHDPGHTHERNVSPGSRMALILILGSSPMVEGIPAFFAAARLGFAVVAVMSLVFAASTIATYMLLCVYSARTLSLLRLGPLERYGEVLSGTVVALVGVVFLVWPL